MREVTLYRAVSTCERFAPYIEFHYRQHGEYPLLQADADRIVDRTYPRVKAQVFEIRNCGNSEYVAIDPKLCELYLHSPDFQRRIAAARSSGWDDGLRNGTQIKEIAVLTLFRALPWYKRVYIALIGFHHASVQP